MRAAVLDAVTSRPAWAQVLLDRAEADPALRAQIEPGRRVTLVRHSNPKLAERAAAIFEAGVDQNRQAVIDRYLAASASRRGEVANGATVFANACSACHKFGDVPGRLIGPDLATVRNRTPDALLVRIRQLENPKAGAGL